MTPRKVVSCTDRPDFDHPHRRKFCWYGSHSYDKSCNKHVRDNKLDDVFAATLQSSAGRLASSNCHTHNRLAYWHCDEEFLVRQSNTDLHQSFQCCTHGRIQHLNHWPELWPYWYSRHVHRYVACTCGMSMWHFPTVKTTRTLHWWVLLA